VKILAPNFLVLQCSDISWKKNAVNNSSIIDIY